MKDEMMAKIMDEVMKKMGGTEAPAQSMACEAPQGINEDLCGLTEYVGTAMGHTIGLVIANLDYSVHELLKIDPKYRSIGIIADRTGAGPQIFACDEAVKATNTEVCLIECPRDTEGGADLTSSGSRIAISGIRLSSINGILTPVLLSVTTANCVTSEPVPLVVGRAISLIFF